MQPVAFGLGEILILLLSMSTSPTHDLVSLIDAEDYFKTRKVAVTAEQMAALALKEPKDGKAQVQQLLALRWLGENPAAAKKGQGARAALEQIAAGKKAQDAQGFARLYARQALARLDGKPVPVTAAPNRLAAEAFSWFPADTNVAAAVDLRPEEAAFSGKGDFLRELFGRMMKPRDREELYTIAEGLGNVRVDRLSTGVAVANNGDTLRAAVRISGAGDRARLAGFLAKTLRGGAVKHTRGPRGEAITLISGAAREPALALVGDTDFLVALFEVKGNVSDVISQMLDVRAGKQKGAADGPLAGLLKKAPANARTLFAHDLSEKARAKVGPLLHPLLAVPQKSLAYLTREGTGDATKEGKLAVHFEGVMKDAAEARTVREATEKLKQQALKALDTLPPRAKVPPTLVKAVKETLAGMQVEADGGTVKARLTIANEAVLLDTLKMWFLRVPLESPKPELPSR